MNATLGRFSELLYAVMRIMVGLLFACHGAQKLFGVFGGLGGHPMTPLVFAAAIIELVGGLLVAVGLWAGYAAFISSGEMAVGYFMAHAPGGFWPILNKGELAVLYCFVFLYIASRGSGSLSLEALAGRRNQGAARP